MSDPARLLQEALRLPEAARAALAGSLLESLEKTFGPDAEEKWAIEITRRIQELDAGAVQPVPWSQARRMIRSHRNEK